MSDEQINIAIAEVCGWTERHKGLWVESMQTYAALPNYCNDLNAMHDAEKTMDLLKLKDMEESVSFHFASMPFHATARQRAEAFLRTLGKWEGAK